jgi:SNF2 family DNA or RNA helicase
MADIDTDNDITLSQSTGAPWMPEYLLKSLDIAFQNQLTVDSKQIEQPQNIRIQLRSHQRALIHQMLEREKASMAGIQFRNTKTFANYGILGDEVGSGKSLVILGYLAYLKEHGDIPQQQSILYPFSNSHLFSISTKQYKDTSGTNLIVVPHTIYRQWQDYCKHHTTLKVFFAKSHKEIADGYSKDLSGHQVVKNNMLSADAVLCSNTLYSEVQYVAKNCGIRWKRIFVDEADSIHIPSTNMRPNAAFTWFITATWANLLFHGSTIRPALLEFYQNHQTMFTAGLGDWLRNELGISQYNGYAYGRTTWLRVRSNRWLDSFHSDHALRAITLLCCSKPFLDESQQMPQIVNTQILCEQPASHRAIASVVSTEIAAMLHAGNVEGALQHLGIPEDTPMNIVEAVTHERTKELDRLQKTLTFKEQLDYATPQAKEAALATLRSKIVSVQAQLKTIQERLTNIKTEECPICYEDPKQNQATLTPCCHRIFCGGCILESLKRGMVCPMCRATIQSTNLTQLVDETKKPKKEKKKEDSKVLSKPKSLLKFLKENKEARVLVFSRYENPFVALEKSCEDEGITYHTLRGNKDVIASTIKSFEKGEKRVLFLPTQTAGAGLNLVSATHIVLLHAMTPEEEKQVIGRAYRLGRTQQLNVVRFLHEGESILSQG